MRKTKVAVDIDGVIWDLVTPWLKYYNIAAHDNVYLEDIKSYQISKYVKQPEMLQYILTRNLIWQDLKLYDGVYESIERLQNNQNVDLVITTATSPETPYEKFARFFELLPMLDEKQLIITPRKDLLYVDCIIDDWENNLKCNNDRCIIPILITQPYNISFPAQLYGIMRVKNLAEAVDMIEGIFPIE